MGKYLDEKEARERMEERMRKSGYDKKTAKKEADGSVGRVFDTHEKKGS